MKIVEVLNAKPEAGVITITPDAGVRELIAKLAEHNVGALIVSGDGSAVGFGKSAPGQTYPAVYVWGRYKGVWGIFRSDDAGASWLRINDDAHQYGGGMGGQVIGDPRQFGLVYITTSGRGVALGQPASDLNPAQQAQK